VCCVDVLIQLLRPRVTFCDYSGNLRVQKTLVQLADIAASVMCSAYMLHHTVLVLKKNHFQCRWYWRLGNVYGVHWISRWCKAWIGISQLSYWRLNPPMSFKLVNSRVSTDQGLFIIMLKLLQDGAIFVCVIGNNIKSYSHTDAVGCCVVMSVVIMCCVCSFAGCGKATCIAWWPHACPSRKPYPVRMCVCVCVCPRV
jgi:hypothetical protein